ncbi:hypothetical protein AB835_11560 [Candidatus Endobugula sertula]|uniref:Uncharacterized protein n=1 Tax=Candidatus Endobugula sertula TaxID=62101 RepID=A0A1D2QMY6_9GAMM|nr:hypothetical protein AB835_11560 [Candidatus Endobugula sertula]
MMATPPPRRHYGQMVRVVREDTTNPFSSQVPYQLGKAYGKQIASATETRIRSLDELGIHSRSPNQSQAPATDNNYNRRESSTLYHQLSADQKRYFDGMSPNSAPTRLDARPGGKSRTYLGDHAISEDINIMTGKCSIMVASSDTGEQSDVTSYQHNNSDFMKQLFKQSKVHDSLLKKRSSTVDIRFSHPTLAPKQTRLPMIQQASLEGTAKTGLGFSLAF